MKLIPLLKILAINPATSPVIPPPTLITKSTLLNFFDSNLSKNLFTVFNDLVFSFELNEKKLHPHPKKVLHS